MIASVLTSILGMAVLLVAWLGVQVAWRRQGGLACGEDPLAGRLGCRGCGCEGSVRRAQDDVVTDEGDEIEGDPRSRVLGGGSSRDSVSFRQR